MLKFEKTANLGDVIKAFDFKPMAGRPDYFLTGIVMAKGPMYREIENDQKVYIGNGYTVKVVGADDDQKARGIVGHTMYVPFEVDFMEYDNRVTLVATKEEVEILITNQVEIH